jgi:hypothetical protein
MILGHPGKTVFGRARGPQRPKPPFRKIQIGRHHLSEWYSMAFRGTQAPNIGNPRAAINATANHARCATPREDEPRRFRCHRFCKTWTFSPSGLAWAPHLRFWCVIFRPTDINDVVKGVSSTTHFEHQMQGKVVALNLSAPAHGAAGKCRPVYQSARETTSQTTTSVGTWGNVKYTEDIVCVKFPLVILSVRPGQIQRVRCCLQGVGCGLKT